MHIPKPPKQAPPADGRRAPPRSSLRYSSTEGGNSSSGGSSETQALPSATASPAALSTVNNRILQLHAQQFQLLQQQMLKEHLLAQDLHTCADTESEDDAPVPVARYAHMTDTPLPKRDPQIFEAWKVDMQTKLQQRLQQVQQEKQQQPSAPAGNPQPLAS